MNSALLIPVLFITGVALLFKKNGRKESLSFLVLGFFWHQSALNARRSSVSVLEETTFFLILLLIFIIFVELHKIPRKRN